MYVLIFSIESCHGQMNTIHFIDFWFEGENCKPKIKFS